MQRIIGLTGLKGAGKTEVSRQLEAYGFWRVSFAAPLKEMLRTLGLSEREIAGDRKEQPCALLGGQTPRYAMQTLGTEWGREMIHPDLWVLLCRDGIEKLNGGPVVVDDLRFENEEKMLREIGATIWRVTRPGNERHPHISESYIESMPVDIEIANDRGVERLREKVTALLVQ